MKPRALVPVCAGLALMISACTTTPEEVGSSPEDNEQNPGASAEPFEPVLAPRLLAEMDLDDKIGQLLVLSAQGTTAEENASLIETHRPGGLIYFDANLDDAEQIARMSAGVQEIAAEQGQGVPLFLGIDQEQGRVVRMPVGTLFPDAMAVGATGDTELAALRAATTANELTAVGINLNYAPDADVNTDPNNPVIGIRSFGSDPDAVAEMVLAEADAYAENGVVPVAKHFPGHGDTDVDSHSGLPVIDLPRDRWEAEHLPPFRAAVEAGIDSIMTAHVLMPGLESDEDPDPATLSPTLIDGILRDELGYDGVVTTDALNMDGVRQRHSDGEVAVRVIEAGVDQLLMPPNPEEAVAAIHEAVESGRIDEERIDRSVLRVLTLKEKRGILEAEPVDPAAATSAMEDPDHAEAAQRVADASVTLLRNENDLLPLAAGTDVRVTGTGADRIAPALADAGMNVVESGEAVLVVGTSGARSSEEQRSLVASGQAQGTPVVVVSQDGPYDLEAFPDVEGYLALYSAVEVSRVAAARVISGQVEPTGTLPVDIPAVDMGIGTGLRY
ncbi:glycoside hydrolase family 3 protein [Nocardiopsis sp. LDBS1602]|uniref:glycoside hydrolase family 3 protein n=1 Tax=Nocardiopsis sp. LDBS1602 TaxID=3109597 RepID=UPI002DBEA478|nr:glycoside hydrolase family 3 N-terminal domain-containing protein [Nocardiopsis sp. LDBS1602]MEC3893125.1 glycoside hydrolase family 3 N-terminal domain-containing protein [Nocardiopsis sp. LDBS1602]